ncbi:MAG: isoaspartyl peptidase [Actinobacteria bacterium]|nr:isoaspartyl peptidase [Actinomycetota bacterium]MSV70421.1 isoaspartyl peptidase [Actinomycetota bacterium]MSW13410.1 isoaspartyl peptidase [Actinomycetota bacterium]MSX46290.1 isoaspartyl peptidase [Actinomycetota bacterium]MSX90502.1 isoaspartyl peptidase [Actinomycetota bacterium]
MAVKFSPIIIGSERSEAGIPAAMEILRAGGSALDAVERGLRLCEDNLEDHYIGTSGLPNARGIVELDASIMIGSTRAFGAVAAVKNYPNPISIARKVLEELPQHSILVGEGAEDFAKYLGFPTADLITPESKALWLKQLESVNSESIEGENTKATSGDERYRLATLELLKRMAPHDGPWGTINIIAVDQSGELVCGVSTSGYPYKHPGRVGDSAIAGAGNYADIRYGAAACTGRGELAIRGGTARSVVENLRAGQDPQTACANALLDARSLLDDFRAELRCLSLTQDGRHGGAAGMEGSTYTLMTEHSTAPEFHPRRAI